MSRLNEIREYFIKLGEDEEKLKNDEKFSVYLSWDIMDYAHRNQKRENGEPYANHPKRCLQSYRDLVGIDPDDYFCISKDKMYENGIPFEGVQEVCLLHDVIEDTDFTIDEIEEIFEECELGDYFKTYIKSPLLNITHDKSMDYKPYIEICMKHPISALCKMLDLQDNINVLTLTSFNEENYKRTQNYLTYMHIINEKFHFIEGVTNYKKAFKKSA